MRAALVRQHGGPEAINVEEFPTPRVGSDEVLVQVKAAGLNRLDIFVRQGMPGFPIPLPHIPGGDAAGVVAAVGAGVAGVAVGQQVLVDPWLAEGENFAVLGEHTHGTMAEFVKVPARNVIPLPADLTFEVAAALPVAYATAWRMLVTRARIQPGETVLVLGAAGGVGVACVQIAALHGCRVLAAAGSPDKLERLAELGAEVLINYNEHPEFHRAARKATDGRGADVVVDFVGADTWVKSLKSAAHGGRVVTCGATTGFDPKTDIRYIWTRELDIRGSNGWTRPDLLACVEAARSGRLRVVIDRILPLDEIQAAHRLMESRQVLGKIILRP